MQPPIFITGQERSGTTLVYRIVLSHRGFAGDLSNLPESRVFVAPDSLLEDFEENRGLMAYLRFDPEQHAAFQREISDIRALNESLDGEGVARRAPVWENADPWVGRRYRDLIVTFFDRSVRISGQKRILEKTPAHFRHVPEIFDCYPDARVLVCSRSPVAVLASMRRRYRIQSTEHGDDARLAWLKIGAADYATYFVYLSSLLDHYRERWGEQMLVLNYESFVESPDASCRALAEFLDLDPSALDPSFVPEINPGVRAWDPLIFEGRVVRKNVESGLLSEEEIAVVEQRTRPLLGKWRIPAGSETE